MVCNVPSPFNTVGSTVSTTVLYPELKSSSDMHPATLHNFPSSISPVNPVYVEDTILDRVYVSHRTDPVWSLYSRILQWRSTTSASCTYRSKYTMLYILQIDDDTTMEFWILSCAEIYQRILGGEIYAVPQPPSDVEQL